MIGCWRRGCYDDIFIMWSYLYGYYEIRGLADYSISENTETIKMVLDGLPELKRVSLISYENAEGTHG